MTNTFDLAGNAATAFPFDTIGATVTGKILACEEIQQTDMTSGEPAFWPGGQPKMQYRVTLATSIRDASDSTDDGKRSVYLRGSRKAESHSSLAAVLEAVRQAGSGTQLAAGGTLTLTYIADGTPSTRGFNPPKQYQARYSAPNVNLAADTDTPPF